MPVTMIASGLIQESGNVSYPRVLYYLWYNNIIIMRFIRNGNKRKQKEFAVT